MAIVAPISNICFNQLLITFSVTGGSQVSWRLSSGFNPGSGAVFYLQFSHSGAPDEDEWLTVAQGTDVCMLTDPTRRLFGALDMLACYRVRLIAKHGDIRTSPSIQAVGKASRHDFLIGREIFRKEALRLQRFVGKEGWLFKAKRFGDECTECIDQDTKDVTDSDCPVCYGTGIIGGYHQGETFWFELGLQSSNIAIDPNHGPTEHVLQQSRAVASPNLDDYDLWIRKDTDERYFVRGVKVEAFLAYPVVVTANLFKSPMDHIVYTLPRPDRPVGQGPVS